MPAGSETGRDEEFDLREPKIWDDRNKVP
jgi:hypothetical protein